MRLKLLMLAMVTCASGLNAQTQFHLQPLSAGQSAAINSAVRNNNSNIYHNYERNFIQNQPVLNQSEHIARLQGIIQSGQGQTLQNQPGHLGRLQGIIQSGTQPVLVQPGAGLEYNSQTVRQVQTALKRLGYYQGRVDGQFGSNTQSALQNYQLQSSQPATGLLDRRTLSLLGVHAKNATSPTN